MAKTANITANGNTTLFSNPENGLVVIEASGTFDSGVITPQVKTADSSTWVPYLSSTLNANGILQIDLRNQALRISVASVAASSDINIYWQIVDR